MPRGRLFEHIPFAAAEAIRVWTSQRGVPLDSVEGRGGILEYGHRVLSEDSRVSVCPSR